MAKVSVIRATLFNSSLYHLHALTIVASFVISAGCIQRVNIGSSTTATSATTIYVLIAGRKNRKLSLLTSLHRQLYYILQLTYHQIQL